MAAPPTALAPAPAAPAAPAESSASVKSIMARFWYSCALFCGAALLLPLLKPQMENDEDLSVEDVSGHQLQLGVTFFAIAVMAWTFIAAWFCYCSPLLFTEESIRRAKGSEGEVLDVSRSVLQRVAQGFADFIVENSKRDEKSGCDVATSLRSLDFAKFEELVAVAPAAAASALYGYKGASSRQMFDKKGALLREGANEANESSSSKSVNGQSSAFEAATADIPQLDAPHLNLFKELLRDRLVANLMSEGQKDSEGNWKSNLRLPSRWFSNEKTSARDTSQGDEDGLEELLRELLQSTLDGPTQAEHESTRKEDMPFAASMAEHARTIGDKCFKEQQFVAAVHCYEVATLLCPSGPSGCSEQLASCHCNCASACLELGRYGDAISECHAALVLMPSLQLTTRALQRLAAAHICLKNHWEALRCLQNCLELEPGNALLQKLMQRLERQRAASSPQLEVPCDLVWSDICIQGAGFARDKGARKRKGKQKSRLLPGEERQIEREAGIWHTMVAHNSKLYIFGGLQSAGEAQEKDLNLESSSTGSEELQILDLDTLELFQSSGSSRVPQACYCHSATVLDNSMLIFGGSVDGLMVFDFAAAKWRSQPCQGPHPRRQGHSATAMEQGLCVYGGIELMEQCNGRVCNDAHLLDTKSWTWKKLDCAGTIPAARFGHTATKLSPPGPPGLLIIGGRDQMTSSRDFVHDHSGLHILDTSKRSWSEQGFTGKPPEKVFGHFACTWTARSLLLVTGEASEKRDTQGVELFFLDLEKWIWSQPVVAGLLPCSRLGHAVAAADERVYLFGGLILRGDQPAVDKTIYMLQTEGMRDSKISKELWDLDELERISPEEKSERQILGDEESPGVSGDKEVLTDLPGPETCEFAGDQNEEGEDEPELTFEELLEQEKAFFKLQSKKASFPRQQVEARRKENRSNKKQGRS